MLGHAVLLAATVTMGLNAGLFYAFSMGAMPGLARTGDETFVHAMQQINRAILNPWLALILAGPGVLMVVSAVVQLGAGDRGELPWTIAGFGLYLAMLVITMGINVPLNNQLDRAQPATTTDFASVRGRFEASWVRWNIVRTVAATASFGCLAVALVLS